MPYKKTKELPEGLKHTLPQHAQEIYMAAYNSAHAQYFKKEARRDPDDSLEEVCHKVAWAAVKEKYHKTDNERWVLKD